MNEILQKLARCIERGKSGKDSPYPPDMREQDGASELILKALDNQIDPQTILRESLVIGMRKIGEKFSAGEAFIPDLLMSAQAMKACMKHLKPFFESGNAVYKGKIIIGTVAGDLHEIGKNIVGMVLEGDGWEVLDLGVDVTTDKFVSALKDNPKSVLGMSSLLTTTMLNMRESVKIIKGDYPETKIYIGGAPVTQKYSDDIGADGYFPDPYKFANYLQMEVS